MPNPCYPPPAREKQTTIFRFKDAKGLGKCLNSLGTAYWWKGDPDRALSLYRQADDTNKEVNQPYVLGLTANNAGYVYLEKELYRNAYETFRRAREIRHKLDIESYEMMDVSGMALASHCLKRAPEAKELSRVAVKALGKFSSVENLERAYYNHYVIMAGGTGPERAAGARALQRALGLVNARMRRIGDERILARFREVPLVKAILEAAAMRHPLAKGSSVPRARQAAAGSRRRSERRSPATVRSPVRGIPRHKRHH